MTKSSEIEEIRTIVRSILISRSNEGTTLSEILDYFMDIIGEIPDIFKAMNNEELAKFLLSMSDVWFEQQDGIYLWYAASEKSSHIQKLIMNQKVKNHKNRKYINSNQLKMFEQDIMLHQHQQQRQMIMENDRNCYFKDNYTYRKQTKLSLCNNNPNIAEKRSINKRFIAQKKLNPITGSIETISSCSNGNSFDTGFCDGGDNNLKARNGYFYDYQLLGDDHLMALSSAELNGKSEYTRVTKGKRQIYIQNIGLCYSGQTIKAAIKRINSGRHFVDKKVIINLGSVDLLHGHDLIDMQSDFCELIDTLENRKIVPIITTLAPIANFGYIPEQKRQLLRFNNFLRSNFNNVIDLWQKFVKNTNTTRQTIFELYKSEPTYVTGSCLPHVLWNKIGRQIAVKFLKKAVVDCCYS